MKKITHLLLAAIFLTAPAFGAGRLSSVSVSENGTVMLTTGSPNEFKSFWSGQAGSFKMIIEMPGVTVDNSAKVLGNLAANRGIKSVRFSQFKTEPPVARVVIETPERLSYSWSTKPDGVELHFMLPTPVTSAAGTTPTGTGFTVPSSAFLQTPETGQTAAAVKRPTLVPPVSSARVAAGTAVPTATDAKPSESSSQNRGANTASPTIANKTATLTLSPTTKTGMVSNSKGANDSVTGATNKAAATGTAGTSPSQTKQTNTGTTPATGSIPQKNIVTVKPVPARQSKDSTAPIGAVSIGIEKTGTTTPSKSTPPAGTASTPASGGTGVVVKPSSPAPVKQAPTSTAPVPVTKPSAPASTPNVVGVPTQTAGFSTTGKLPATVVKPTVSGPPAPATVTATKSAAGTSKPVAPAAGKLFPPAPATAGTPAAKPATAATTADTVNQEKFREQLKKALGKLETPAQMPEAKPVGGGPKDTLPIEKLGETSFQEQLKKALNPAQSLTDTGEVAGVDDIDTDLPATDEDEEPQDTSFAFPGGTFMQVSPSRKVIRYHSEGRRDPFSPLTGRDRYASGKKRRAVPAAEQLRLVGIMRSLAGNKALLEDGEGNGYILAPGDRVRNGYLVSVSENKVLFQVTEYGWTKTVAMELGNLE